MSLPPFLEPRHHDPQSPFLPYIEAIFRHPSPLGPSHALWWPTKSGYPGTVILFLPGNPGSLNFYTQFLTAVHSKDESSTLAILAHSHIGHTPGIGPTRSFFKAHHSQSLIAQINASLDIFDAIRAAFGTAKLVIVGHSVGSWLALQVLRERPDAVSALFLLFPTIVHIKNTARGRKISWLFSPYVRTLASCFSCAASLIPATTILSTLFSGWPLAHIEVLRDLISSPSSVYAVLQMAHDEMFTIRNLDVALLHAHQSRLWFYFAEQDDWVGEHKSTILSALSPDSLTNVANGPPDIPHAFSINHSEPIAEQCHQWLQSIA